MRKISAVIGANYGDEGKGLVTDYLASRSKSLVVRFNGGAQAGHTVVTPNGIRHVFHTFGSGTLTGAATFLSEHFIANPMFFRCEREQLHQKGFNPVTYVDLRSPVTTPFDLMLNQAAEELRGNARHGSCGMGIGETIQRNCHDEYTLTLEDLYSTRWDLCKKLERIRDEYVPLRAGELGISPEKLTYWKHGLLLSNFLDDCEYFMDHVEQGNYDILRSWEGDTIFEGAQGLRLDMNGKDFPHVTRSNTGLKNVISLLQDAELESDGLDVHYVTRPYVTRHGAGPLPYEQALPKEWKVVDETNVRNVHQGTLRFGLLDIFEQRAEIKNDLKLTDQFLGKVYPRLAITCLDQVPEMIECVVGGEATLLAKGVFIQKLMGGIDADTSLCSYGPTRNTLYLGA